MHLDLLELPMPITLRTAAPVSDQDLILFAERNKPYKVERNREGEITIMTPVGGIGSTHEAYVAAMLYIWANQDGRGMALGPNAGFNLPDGSCLAPDACWFEQKRWTQLTPEQQAGFLPFCPDFVIEIRSQSDSRRLLETKMKLWLENGAQLAWLIDPQNASITIYRSVESEQTIIRPFHVEAGPPVSGFVLKTLPLWP